MRYLLIVEGERTEKHIFQRVLERYGMVVDVQGRISTYAELGELELAETELHRGDDHVLIVQAPKNRLGELLKLYGEEDFELSFRFGKRESPFNFIFLIFDVDHTSNKDLEEIFRLHQDETDTGLLLLSSPCIEVMSDPGRRKELAVDHLRTYKKERNICINDTMLLGCSVEEYIANNFEALAVFFLDQNCRDFHDDNVMNHPAEVVEMVNRYNDRTSANVVYRYFTTVIYVVLACVFGLQRQVDNSGILREFLVSHSSGCIASWQ